MAWAHSGKGRIMKRDDAQERPLEIVDGSAAVPDADGAADADDLAPEDPPPEAAAVGNPDKKPAVAPPVPAHGEMASQEQLDEGERAVGQVESPEAP